MMMFWNFFLKALAWGVAKMVMNFFTWLFNKITGRPNYSRNRVAYSN